MYKRCKESPHPFLDLSFRIFCIRKKKPVHFRSTPEFVVPSTLEHDAHRHLRRCGRHLPSDNDQCADLVYFLVAVSTNRHTLLLLHSTQLHLLSSYCISCIYVYIRIYYVYRPGRSKSTTSFQNLYPRQPTLSSKSKTSSNYPTNYHTRRLRTQSSAPHDDTSTMSNHLMRRDRILPQAAVTNRLKTLRSLLFRGHKTLGIDPRVIHNQTYPNRDLDSTLSEYHIRSVSQSLAGTQRPRTPYEEQEDCLELKSEYSVLTNRNHGFLNKIKSNQEPRQINSWDDI